MNDNRYLEGRRVGDASTHTPVSLSRRSFLKAAVRATTGMTLASAAGGVYATWLEPQWIAVESIEVKLKRLPPAFDGFRLVQLSDLHYDSTPKETIVAAVDAAAQLAADVVVLTGDYVTRSRSASEACAAELARLQAPYGVLGVLGNHDWWTASRSVSAALKASGVSLLRNEALPIERDGARLWVAGVDDVWEKRADVVRALHDIPREEVTVLLAHEPDFADEAARHPIDLQLSGHSHGGQVRLPFVGALFLPNYGRKYPIGLQRAGDLQVYTSRGVGMVRPAVRFNCRPEVTHITLRVAR